MLGGAGDERLRVVACGMAFNGVVGQWCLAGISWSGEISCADAVEVAAPGVSGAFCALSLASWNSAADTSVNAILEFRGGWESARSRSCASKHRAS